jgi:hypothetical protein
MPEIRAVQVVSTDATKVSTDTNNLITKSNITSGDTPLTIQSTPFGNGKWLTVVLYLLNIFLPDTKLGVYVKLLRQVVLKRTNSLFNGVRVVLIRLKGKPPLTPKNGLRISMKQRIKLKIFNPMLGIYISATMRRTKTYRTSSLMRGVYVQKSQMKNGVLI